MSSRVTLRFFRSFGVRNPLGYVVTHLLPRRKGAGLKCQASRAMPRSTRCAPAGRGTFPTDFPSGDGTGLTYDLVQTVMSPFHGVTRLFSIFR